MSQANIDKAINCLRDYFEVTVLEPCNAIKKLRKEGAARSSTPFQTYSIRELIKKQAKMSSPEIGDMTISPVNGLRANYLKSLNTNQSTLYISRSF